AVRRRITVHAAQLCFLKPRGLVADYFRVNHLRDMAADGVISQCGGILFLTADLAVGNKSQLDQRLETVTDSKGKTVSLVQELHDSFFDLRVLERCGKEFRGAVRLVACGKSAGEHDDLRLGDRLFKHLHRITDIFRRKIAEYLHVHFRSRTAERTGAVIFAVGSGEYRDEYSRFRHFMVAYIDPGRAVYAVFDHAVRVRGLHQDSCRSV